jgi:hypothetical protein
MEIIQETKITMRPLIASLFRLNRRQVTALSDSDSKSIVFFLNNTSFISI